MCFKTKTLREVLRLSHPTFQMVYVFEIIILRMVHAMASQPVYVVTMDFTIITIALSTAFCGSTKNVVTQNMIYLFKKTEKNNTKHE